MRIISGKLKGKKIFIPKDKTTRPLKDLDKESIFNIINHSNKFDTKIDNSIIFDYSKIGKGVRLVDKLVFGRYCVGKNGDHFDLQDASLDWLITDSRRSDMTEPSPQQKAMAELLGTDLINIPD